MSVVSYFNLVCTPGQPIPCWKFFCVSQSGHFKIFIFWLLRYCSDVTTMFFWKNYTSLHCKNRVIYYTDDLNFLSTNLSLQHYLVISHAADDYQPITMLDTSLTAFYYWRPCDMKRVAHCFVMLHCEISYLRLLTQRQV